MDAAVVAAAAAADDRGPGDVTRPDPTAAASAKAQPDAGGDRRPTDVPTVDDPVADPSWVLPAAHPGGGVRRMVWAGLAAMLLVGVLVASAAARGRSPEPAGAEATTPPSVDAVEAPQQPDTGDRQPDGAAGATVTSGGGGGGGTRSGTGAPPPPTESARDTADTDVRDTGGGDAEATEDPDTTGDAGDSAPAEGVDADAPVSDGGDEAPAPDDAAAEAQDPAEAQGASSDGAAGQEAP